MDRKMFIVCLSKKTTGWHLASESETKQCLDGQRQRWDCAAATRGSERIPPRPVKKRHSAPGPAALVDSFWNSLEGSDGFHLCTPAIQFWLGEGLLLSVAWRVWSLGGMFFSVNWAVSALCMSHSCSCSTPIAA